MKADNKLVAIFTVDVDGWPSHLKYYLKDIDEEQSFQSVPLELGVLRLIDLLEPYQIKGTFFMPGVIARKLPLIVNKISKNGHEVACHGMYHGKDEFLGDYSKQEDSIRTATRILQDLINKKILGFRAPAFRYDSNTTQILLNYGYIYDSSSIKTWGLGLYGRLLNSRCVGETKIKNQYGVGLKIIPIATTPLLPIPMGGTWLRVLSYRLIDITLDYYKRLNTPLVLYIHPRDVSVLPRIKGIPWYTYSNTGTSCLKILHKFIASCKREEFRFLTMQEYCQEILNNDKA